MRYIRTKDGIYEIDRDLMNFHKIVATEQAYPVLRGNDIAISAVVQSADNIEDLIQAGDLVKIADLGTQYPYQEDYAVVTELFMPHHTAIYRVMELYVKQANGDWRLVAKDKGNCKLELV